MATKVIMPKQGLQMTEGLITRWLVQEGQAVALDEPLFEMETDKLNIEIPSPASGTLLKIVRAEGETVPITDIIAIIGEPGEDISQALESPGGDLEIAAAEPVSEEKPEPAENAARTADPRARIFISPRAKNLAAENNLELSALSGTGPEGLIIEKDVLDHLAKAQSAVKATPLAAKLALQKEIPIGTVTGTGARGKITRADVEAAAAVLPANLPADIRQDRLIPFAGIRKVIADRMMVSSQGMAQANHRMKVDMSEAIRLREKLKAAGIKVSYSDIIVKVAAQALCDFPLMNSSMTAEGILMKASVNIGLAVAIENGLIVPVIKQADQLTLPEIAAVSADLADKARSGKLLPQDYANGTFTITNLGMYDVDEFTAIINPPESGILAVGKIDRVPVAEGDNVVVRPVMMLSLTYDHRIIDGAPAAQFLQKIKQLLQNPFLLI